MNIYHNEIDQRCCDVLHRQFTDDVIDNRSIEDVQPEDLSEYQQCHFFAGIGGFSLGFRNAGVGASVNVWTGGFPCQDLSIAGKRKGLAGERSGLYFQFHRLITSCYPRWVVIENVPGLLSSAGGNDFAIVVGGLTGIVPQVPETGWGNAGFFRGPVYSVAYRVFDAQFFGVAQCRRRVFIVGHLAGGRASEVLFEREGGCWDPAPSREAGQGVARAIARSSVSSGYRYDANGEDFAVIAARPAQTGSNGWGILEDGSTHTLDSTGGDVIAFNPQSGGDMRLGIGDKPTALQANQVSAIAWHGAQITSKENRGGVFKEVTPTLNGDSRSMVGVRRLTPTECCRLQGFPDDWNAGLPDSTRYRQLGNAVAVPVVEWIGRRIAR